MANLAKTNDAKTCKMIETLHMGVLSDLYNEYKHDRVKILFKNLCNLVLWTKVASALERLTCVSKVQFLTGNEPLTALQMSIDFNANQRIYTKLSLLSCHHYSFTGYHSYSGFENKLKLGEG